MIKCITEDCSNDRAPQRRVCYKCRTREVRKRRPVLAAYYTLKANAKRRGKEFDLTLEQFEQFCHKTLYIGYKGRTGTALSIDRVDSSKGYTMDNIVVLTNSENGAKGFREGNTPF